MAESSLKEKTAKGLFWGGISNGAQQLFAALFGIYLARTLDVDDYSVTGTLAIFIGIASIVINGGFTAALINKKEIVHKDYNAVFWFTFFAGLLIYVLLFFASPLIAQFFDRPELTSVARVVFIGFFFSGIASAHYTVMAKKLMVKEQAKIDITAFFVSSVASVILAMLGYGYWALVIPIVLFAVIGAVLRFFAAPWRPTLEIDFSPLKKMLSFSIKMFVSNIVTQINNSIITVILGKLYKDELGYYVQGNKWAGMGQALLGNMVNSVAQPVLVQANHDKAHQLHVFRKMIRFSAFIAFPAMIGLGFISHEFILITIGDKWMPAIPILQMLCVSVAFYPIWTLFTQLIISYGKSNQFLYGNIGMGIAQIIVLLACSSLGIYWMVLAYVGLYLLSILYWHYFVNRLIHFSLWLFLKDIFPYFLFTSTSFLISWFATGRIENIYLLLAAKIVLFATVYITQLWLGKSVIFKESITFFLQYFKK